MYIQINKLSKSFKDEFVLKDISLSLKEGAIYGFVGRNGCGKTMLLRAVAGLIKPSEGEIIVDGKKLHTDISFPSSMGIIIEKPAFMDHFSGFENLKTLSKIRGTIDDKKIRDTMIQVGLDPSLKKTVKKYSLGMKQRLGIAQAFMEDPDLLILDEPFNALDEQAITMIRELLLQKQKKGNTILLTSHNKDDINLLCDEVFVIESGRIIHPLYALESIT